MGIARSYGMQWIKATPRVLTAVIAAALFGACATGEAPTAPTAPVTPPPPVAFTVPAVTREFRGLWIATVANIDWPSRSGLTVAQQQTEFSLILDAADQAGLNAIVLQVRAAGDALFPSTLEPWSRSLTGTQGVDPGYDPLAYAITQARLRGIEVHAWFNPFRAANLSDTLRLASTHFAVRRPELTRKYCTQLWFDPGAAAVQDQAIAVITDVLRRYDVDAVHLDDFFYPYPDSRCAGLDFPDSATYATYQRGGGLLGRADWRRDNVNRFVERLYREAHLVSPTARVGISPFGIWRPGSPAGIVGLDSYASIYADSRTWLQRGWVDYFAPQLYWSIASTGQSFGALLTWWGQQNTMRRHLWPGLAAYRVSDGSTSAYTAAEIPAQVQLIRGQNAAAGGSTGSLLYNTTVVVNDRGGLRSLLTSGVFAARALPPATDWLDATAPPAPTIGVTSLGAVLRVSITPVTSEPLSWYLIRWRTNGTWSQRLQRVAALTADVPSAGTDGIVVNAIDKVGNASTDVVWRP
ncbi:MAG: hypothetical protein CK550_02280 [Gemmatimonadetes bacterium]|nr:MAG: hypothetical protein CK550_02280 [Gemmatimonadota bacterium]